MRHVMIILAMVLIGGMPVESYSLDQRVGKQEDGKKSDQKPKPEKHPNFKDFQSGSYVIVGHIESYRSRGVTTQTNGTKFHFHEISFSPTDQIRGDYFNAVEKERTLAKLAKPEKWIVTSLFMTQSDKIIPQVKQKNEPCIFVLEPVKASAMAGTIPVRIKHVFVGTDEMIKVARAAADHRRPKK